MFQNDVIPCQESCLSQLFEEPLLLYEANGRAWGAWLQLSQ